MTSSDVPIKAEGQERQRANTNVWRLFLFRAAFIGCSLEASDKKGSFWNWSAWKWGWPTTFELPTSENRPKSPGYMWNYKKDSKKPETTRDPDLEDRQLDFEYLAQSRFWILLFGPDLTWRLEIGGWGIGRGGEGFGLCSRGACGPLGGFQSQTSGQEQADNTTFNPTSSSTSC